MYVQSVGNQKINEETEKVPQPQIAVYLPSIQKGRANEQKHSQTDAIEALAVEPYGSNILWSMGICSRYELFEAVRINHCAMSGSKWR